MEFAEINILQENREIPILLKVSQPPAAKYVFGRQSILSVGISPTDKIVFLCALCASVVSVIAFIPPPPTPPTRGGERKV
jgi:hypothetical protein